MDKDMRKWFVISLLCGACVSSITFFTYLIYKTGKKQDPRIKEVNQLIEEAERLINQSRKK